LSRTVGVAFIHVFSLKVLGRLLMGEESLVKLLR